MLGEFWKSIAGSLADRWRAAAAPALVFWAGIALVWMVMGGFRPLTSAGGWLETQSVVIQIVVLTMATLVATASAIAVNRLTTPALRLLEGYRWPRWARARRARMVADMRERHRADTERWQRLERDRAGGAVLSADQHQDWAELDRRLQQQPSDPGALMPTRIGNILKAAETHSDDKYGLDAVTIWPRLWLVMPDTSRQVVASARSALDAAVSTVIWSLLFGVVSPVVVVLTGLTGSWSWTAPVTAAATVTLSALMTVAAVRWWVPMAAQVFGELIESVFDLHRLTLYERLRWPLPVDPAQEPATGRQLSEYLWRGSDSPYPRFCADEASEREAGTGAG